MSSYQCAPSLSTAVLTNSLWLAYKLTSALSSIQQMAAASSPARSGNLPTCDLACHVSAVTCHVSRVTCHVTLSPASSWKCRTTVSIQALSVFLGSST